MAWIFRTKEDGGDKGGPIMGEVALAAVILGLGVLILFFYIFAPDAEFKKTVWGWFANYVVAAFLFIGGGAIGAGAAAKSSANTIRTMVEKGLIRKAE